MSKVNRDFVVKGDYVTLIDVEAGIEHFGRGVETNVDIVIVIADPIYESFSIAEKVVKLCSEMGIEKVCTILNKVQSKSFESIMTEELKSRIFICSSDLMILPCSSWAKTSCLMQSYFELEILPKGGGAFFLCKMLGYCQAKQLLMSEKDINALEALEMGIVDQVVSYNKLEETAMLMAQDFAKRSIRSLEGIKRLVNYTMKDIQDYLDFESFELLRTGT